VVVPANKDEDSQFIKAVHEPLISEKLFNDVQILLKSRRKKKSGYGGSKALFPLRGYLACPWCSNRLTASESCGRRFKYRYYHCYQNNCKGRFRADIIDKFYEDQLKKVRLIPEVYELFDLVLEDENIQIAKKTYIKDRNEIRNEISNQQTLITKARKLLVSGKIDITDFLDLKNEYGQMLECLNVQLQAVEIKLSDNKNAALLNNGFNIFQSYQHQDDAGRAVLVDFFRPSSINPFDITLGPLRIGDALSKVVKIES